MLQQHITTTHYNNTVQQHSEMKSDTVRLRVGDLAASHCNTLQQYATTAHYNNTLQQHSATIQRNEERHRAAACETLGCDTLQHTATTRYNSTTLQRHATTAHHNNNTLQQYDATAK